MTINDSNWQFLQNATGLSLPFNDMYFRYLRDLGYTGTLQDMIAASGFGMNPSGLKNPPSGGVASPITILGDSLLAWWTTDRADLITLNSTAVISWKDVVAGYDLVQAVSAARPTYNLTSFGGVAGITSDAVDDEMTLAPVPASFPIGASPVELWDIVQQNVAVADTASKFLASYGNGATTDRRTRRVVSSGVNRAGLHTGTGASQLTLTEPTVDFSSRHLLRCIFGATESSVQIDGGALTTTAAVPETAAHRFRMFTSAAATPTGFAGVTRRDMLVTLPLSAQQVTALEAWALPRRML